MIPNLPELKLPSFEARIEWKENHEHIWDIVRKQWIVLTPEEWVRQHFIHLLIEKLDYPRSLFKVESTLTYAQKTKRSDIQVLRPDGKVHLLVECKSPSVKLGENTLRQVAEYNKTLQSSHLAITNGLKHHVWKYNPNTNQYEVLREFPLFSYD
jgi:hypothetical protein